MYIFIYGQKVRSEIPLIVHFDPYVVIQVILPFFISYKFHAFTWVSLRHLLGSKYFAIQSSFTLIQTLELSGISQPHVSLKCCSQIVKVISENQSNPNSIVKQTTKTLISIFCFTNICFCDLHFMLQEICHGFAFFSSLFAIVWLLSSFHAARNLPWFALSVVIFGTTIWQRLTGNNKIHLFSEKVDSIGGQC